MSTAPLAGRVALVTGVSRQQGIGVAVARRLHERGAAVFATGWSAHDAEMTWGVDDATTEPFEVRQHDLAAPGVPAALIQEVLAEHEHLDIVVAVHARSSSHGLGDTTATELDRCWAVNVRSVVLLAKHFAEGHDRAHPGGRMLWFTSGQHLEPMPDELPYAISKGALHQLTGSLAAALIGHGIVANCINPGPVDTGWATGDEHRVVAEQFPDGRWGTPEDVANLVSFLVSDEGAWIQGQVLNSEGGFRRQ